MTYQSGGHLQGCDEKTMGICHGSDLEFVFFRTGANPKLDIPFSKEWITLWTNFAKTGVPTSDKKWPKLVNKAEDYKISRVKDMNPYDFSKTLVDQFKRECNQFWTQYYQ
ncbi:unnamed protein product [Medioppia subpectinata]|uniref:Carboxylesterase type B domain-containing protein n=1 Tax=Medioppia subpectinata TaxID=1979941 RepID=A0A7R9L1F6_9ACAR|nr:unnamed protein product [Medioppia subpectinata]CAG2113737.1 unnamed protein product [Medioppia subpectinata]